MSSRPALLAPTPLGEPLAALLRERYDLFVGADAAPLGRIRGLVGGGTVQVDPALLARLPALEIVAIHGVGHDRVDLGAARARGVRVTATPGVLTEDVADLAIALMLAVPRRLAANDRALRGGGWSVPLGRRASGRVVGIFGMGAIGQAIARRAAPFASEVVYTARSPKPALPWRFVPDLPSLARECEVLVLAAPATPATTGIVDADVLGLLGPAGVLVNIARGTLVNEPALIAALAAGHIAGAGLDVFADEPDVPDALYSLDNVVVSPHQGSATAETRAAMAALVLANLDAHFAGRPLPSAIV